MKKFLIGTLRFIIGVCFGTASLFTCVVWFYTEFYNQDIVDGDGILTVVWLLGYPGALTVGLSLIIALTALVATLCNWVITGKLQLP